MDPFGSGTPVFVFFLVREIWYYFLYASTQSVSQPPEINLFFLFLFSGDTL